MMKFGNFIKVQAIHNESVNILLTLDDFKKVSPFRNFRSFLREIGKPGRWQSGQMHQTVNLAGFALRRFESYPAQLLKFK